MIFISGYIVGFALVIGLTVNPSLYAIPGLRYMALFLAVTVVSPSRPLLLRWMMSNSTPGAERAVATAMCVSVGTTSAYIASWTYTFKDTPKYLVGHSTNLVFAMLTVASCGFYWLYCASENKRRDRGERDHRLVGLSLAEQQALGHLHPAFRYAI